MRTRNKFDVLGLGTVAVDELIVSTSYPPADCKVRVTHAERQCGGLTAIALIAAARLGARCGYAGMIGRDDLSEFVLRELKDEGIDTCSVPRKNNFPPVHSFIVIDSERHTRNVFSHRAVEYRLPANWPPRELIESTRVLFVDHSGLPSMIRAARIAATAGIPIVADLERDSGERFGELLDLVDHLIVSRKFAETLTGQKSPERVLRALCTHRRKLVAITDGERGCWYVDESDRVQHQPAFKVRAVDTTGCGDVFHGAYAAALAFGMSSAERIRCAAVAAALKAQKLGAQAGIPRRREVEAAAGIRIRRNT